MTRRIAAVSVSAAIALVAALVGVQLTGEEAGPAAPAFQRTATEVEALLEGIPQKGAVLGRPDAPVSVVEYIDYKCSYCAEASKGVVRDLIAAHVRTGRVRLELRPVRLGAHLGGGSRLGPDSAAAALAGIAAGNQDRMWEFTKILLANQGPEGTEWITDRVILDAATAAGLDTTELRSDLGADASTRRLIANEASALADGYRGTPYYVVTGPGGRRPVEATDDRAAFDAAISAVSRSRGGGAS